MVLLDTSAWVDYLRATPGRTTSMVRDLLVDDRVVCCDPVAMEILAGAPDPAAHQRLLRLVNGLPMLVLEPAADFHAAAGLFRSARRNGRTVRSLMDCLIASIAIRHGVELAHKDADYRALAEVSPLTQTSLG